MTAFAPPISPSSRRRRPQEKHWGGSLVLPDLHRSITLFLPVLALTILRTGPDGRAEILVGVRDPAVNRTHQNVTSVPTRRVSEWMAGEWKRRLRRGEGGSGDGFPGVCNEVVNLLGLKLGLADALERGQVALRLGAIGASQGISVIGEHPDGSRITENLTMFNAVVHLDDGDRHIPARTVSYSSLVWADVHAFGRMVRSRDVGQLGVGLESAFACAYGLCLQTSLKMLDGPVPDRPGRVDVSAGGIQREQLALFGPAT